MSSDQVRFGSLFAVPQKNGLTRPKKVRGAGVPMVNMGELFAHPRIGCIEMDRVPLSEAEANFLLQPGDLLFARQSLVLAGAGQCSLFLGNDQPTTFESHLIRCRLDRVFANPNFYFYFFRSDEGRKVVEAIVEQGAGASGIRGSDLVNVLVPHPPRSVQDEMAGVLVALDDRIALLSETNATLEAIAQALFKSWFVDFDPVRAKQQGLAPAGMDEATAALFPDSFEESMLGTIPKGWSAGTLNDLCLRSESGGTPKRSVSAYWGGDISWLSSGEVRSPVIFTTKETITELGMRESAAKLWPSGTTVVAMYGATAGEVCLLAEPTTANQACCGLIPGANSRALLFFCARRERASLASKSSGSAQQNLNKALVSQHAVVVPAALVSAKYESVAGSLLDGWIANERQAQTLATIRDTLLPRLISGQVRLSEVKAHLQAA